MPLSHHARLEAFSLARSATDAELSDLMKTDAARYVDLVSIRKFRKPEFMASEMDEVSERLDIFAAEAGKRGTMLTATYEYHEVIATRRDVLQYEHNARWPMPGDPIQPTAEEEEEYNRLVGELFAIEELRPDLAAGRGALSCPVEDF